MGTTRRILTVFVASPGDVMNERKALAAAVSRVNRIAAREWGWEIDLRGWEDTMPGYARPQELINPDVDECDLFIGILWKRWGQSTGTHSSGFEEEFARAKARADATGSPEIQLYLREVDAGDKDDPGDQLRRVLQFRDDVIRSKQVLFKSFRDSAEWESLIFEHLMRRLGQSALTQATSPARAESGTVVREIGSLPHAVEFLDLASDPHITPERIVDRWRQSHTDPLQAPFIPCGISPHGLYRFDLFNREVGSASLLVGTTGSGKTHALLSIVAASLLTLPPDLLKISLLDFKSSSYALSLLSLTPATNPHGLDGGSSLRDEISALEDELFARQRLLITAGCRDFHELWKRHPELRSQLPFRLVCVDELWGITFEQDDLLERLMAVALRGRSLGMHCILGTQRLAGIGGQVRALSGRRICLRVIDHVESIDAVGVPDAALLPPNAPGSALVRGGIDLPTVVRFGNMTSSLEHLEQALPQALAQYEAGDHSPHPARRPTDI